MRCPIGPGRRAVGDVKTIQKMVTIAGNILARQKTCTAALTGRKQMVAMVLMMPWAEQN